MKSFETFEGDVLSSARHPCDGSKPPSPHPTAASYLTVWPDDAAQPLASDLNWVAGQTIPNLAVVGLGSDGKPAIYSPAGYTDELFDVVGYYS